MQSFVDERAHAIRACVEVIIDDECVVGVRRSRSRDLLLTLGESPSDCRFVISGTAAQARKECVVGGGQHEDAQHVRSSRSHLFCPLHIDVEDDDLAARDRGVDGSPWRAVPRTTEDSCILEEVSPLEHRLEVRLVDEAVVLAIDFAWSGLACRRGHAEHAVESAQHRVRDGSLANAGWSAENDQKSGHGRRHHCASVSLAAKPTWRFVQKNRGRCRNGRSLGGLIGMHGRRFRIRIPKESGARMNRDELRRERLTQIVDLARVYRKWTRIQLAQALGREPAKIVPESGNPKLDLLGSLADALDWDIGDVAEGIWRDESARHGEFVTLAERGFAQLDREAIEAHRAGEYARMSDLAQALFIAAQTGVERATAANRLAGAYDGLGRYTKSLAAIQRGLAEPGVPAQARLSLEANLANAHYTLWHLVESRSVANGLIERLGARSCTSRAERVTFAFGHYVRGQSERRLIETDPMSATEHATHARADLGATIALYNGLAKEFDDASYAGIANTCAGALIECEAALGETEPLAAVESLARGLDQVVDASAYPPGDWLESYGWWAVFGCNVALRGLSGPELHRFMAIFSNKASEIAERTENWSMRERAFTFEYLRRQRMNEASPIGQGWTLDDEDVRTVAGTMGRFPSFRETGWQILESARTLQNA